MKNYIISFHKFCFIFSEVKPSSFLSELDKGRKSAKFLLETVPHIIPHKEVCNNDDNNNIN